MSGAEGWAYDGVVESMKAAETVNHLAERDFDPAERGSEGPFVVTAPRRQLSETQLFVEACGGLYPIVALEKQLLNTIGNLV